MISEYREHAPSAPLRDRVACIWTSREVCAPARAVLPDGCIDLLFDVEEGTLAWVGTMSRALWVEPGARSELVGVRFRPGGALGWLRERADALTDRIVDAGAVGARGTRELAERLREAAAPADRVRLLDAYLARSAPLLEPADARVARACRALWRDPSIRVGALAAELALTRQHARRLLVGHVGLGPKPLARAARVARAAALLRAGTELARAAAIAGFSDQAHMTREFRRVVGTTPARFPERERPQSSVGAPVGRARAGA